MQANTLIQSVVRRQYDDRFQRLEGVCFLHYMYPRWTDTRAILVLFDGAEASILCNQLQTWRLTSAVRAIPDSLLAQTIIVLSFEPPWLLSSQQGKMFLNCDTTCQWIRAVQDLARLARAKPTSAAWSIRVSSEALPWLNRRCLFELFK